MAIPPALRDQLLVEARHRCTICGESAFEIHHIIEQCSGGTDDEENLIVLCPTCHQHRVHRTKEITVPQLRLYKAKLKETDSSAQIDLVREELLREVRNSRAEILASLEGINAYQETRKAHQSDGLSNIESQDILDRARLKEMSGDLLGAIETYKTAFVKPRVDTAIIMNLGACLVQAELFKEAIDLYDQLKARGALTYHHAHPYAFALMIENRFEHAVAQFAVAAEAEPDNSLIRIRYAAALAECGDVERAFVQLDNVKGVEFQRSKLLLTASLHEELGETAKAYSAYLSAYNSGSPMDIVLDRLVTTSYRLGDLESCLQWLFKLPREHGLRQRILAGVLLEVGRTEDALTELEESVEFRTLTAQECNTWGSILQKNGDFDGALSKYRLAVRIEPDNQVSHLLEADALRLTGRHEEARKTLRTYLTAEPSFAGMYSQYGVLCSWAADHDEALAAHQTAVRLEPASAGNHYNLGCGLWLAGYQEDARRELETAFKIDPTLVEASKSDRDLSGYWPEKLVTPSKHEQ